MNEIPVKFSKSYDILKLIEQNSKYDYFYLFIHLCMHQFILSFKNLFDSVVTDLL